MYCERPKGHLARDVLEYAKRMLHLPFIVWLELHTMLSMGAIMAREMDPNDVLWEALAVDEKLAMRALEALHSAKAVSPNFRIDDPLQ